MHFNVDQLPSLNINPSFDMGYIFSDSVRNQNQLVLSCMYVLCIHCMCIMYLLHVSMHHGLL